MGIIKDESIRGIRDGNYGILCRECMSDEDMSDLEEQNIITEDDVEKSEDHYFCDKCKKRL